MFYNKIPLIKRIKKQSHKNIAYAQDLLIEEVYKKIPKAVLHGGTCIWRCYNGNRFSEDLDFYLPKNNKKINELFKSLEKAGFILKKKKISERSIYSELVYKRISIRLEATFQSKKPSLISYEKIDGNIIFIYGLSIEKLIQEKLITYVNRRKIRDLYDIFFLMKYLDNFQKINNELNYFFLNYKSPLDEENLKILILQGIVPNSNEMINYIKRKWKNINI